MSAIDLTTRDLARVLAGLAGRPAVDRAVRARADALAAEIDKAGGGVTARTVRRGAGDYVVGVSGPNLFAREFGGRDGHADPVVAPAIDRAARGGTKP